MLWSLCLDGLGEVNSQACRFAPINEKLRDNQPFSMALVTSYRKNWKTIGKVNGPG